MGVSVLHVRHQLPVIKALARVAAGGGKKGGAKPDSKESPVVEKELAPRPAAMVADYIRNMGGEPSWYKNTLPPHLFPQWGFPLLVQTLDGLPYDVTKVLNGGAAMDIKEPIPMGEPLMVRARLAEVDETETRVLLRQELVTGTAKSPEALACTIFAVIPKKNKNKKSFKKNEPPKVSEQQREVARLVFGAKSGRDFAFLTGDFNPIHWVGWYARMAGFPNTINHGFCTMARTIESLNKNLFSQRPYHMKNWSCRFVRPLVLPGEARVLVDGAGEVVVSPAAGARPFLSGEYATR